MKGKSMVFATFLASVLLVVPCVAQADTYFMDYSTQCRETAMPVTINVDGKYLPTDVNPYLHDGRTMVPMRAAGEALGAKIDWNQSTQTATASLSGREVRFTLWNNTYFVDDTAKKTDVAPMVSGNRTFLPLRVFAEAFGVNVNWNQQRCDVTIDTPAVDEPDPYIPCHIDAQTATMIYKYYVADDSKDSFAGSYAKQYVVPGPGGALTVDDYIFWSKYSDGTYQINHLESAKYDVSSNPRATRDIILTTYLNYDIKPLEGEWKYELYADAPDAPTYYRGPVFRGFLNDGYEVYLINDTFMLQDRFEDDFGGSMDFTDRVYYTKY